MKKAYYFSHDFNARGDAKITAMRFKYGAVGYGWYWMLVEMLAEEESHRLSLEDWQIDGLGMQCQCEPDTLREFLNDCFGRYKLFESDGIWFWSNSLLRRMLKCEEVAAERAAAGKKGAKGRWEKESAEANDGKAIANDGKAIANDGKAIANDGKAITNDGKAMANDGKRKENKINKNKINEKKKEEKKIKDIFNTDKSKASFDPSPFMDTYNAICQNLPRAMKMTADRKRALMSFAKDFTFAEFELLCTAVNESSFHTGGNGRGWKASLDYIIQPAKASAILEAEMAKETATEQKKDPAERAWEEMEKG